MGKSAWMFPGQGSQAVGMGVAAAEKYPAAAELYSKASAILGWDLLDTCRKGPEDHLRQTHIAQPALFVTGCAAAAVLKSSGLAPEAVAGHSIGEYAALWSAGVISFEEGLRLVAERGRLMHEAGQKRPGSMAAILGLTSDQARGLCKQAELSGVVVAVNFNSPEQVVIAGEQAAVAKVVELAPAAGAKRVIPLNVSGAFHSPLMAEAATAMRQALDRVAFQNASSPIVMNADGGLHSKAQDIKEVLARQLDSPVEWVRSMETLKSQGFTVFVECGSGRVLSGLLKRIDKQLQAYSTESTEAIDQTLSSLSLSQRGAS